MNLNSGCKYAGWGTIEVLMVGEVNAVISARLSFISQRVNRPDDGDMFGRQGYGYANIPEHTHISHEKSLPLRVVSLVMCFRCSKSIDSRVRGYPPISAHM